MNDSIEEMKKQGYMSVSEFSTAAGISRQTVYNHLTDAVKDVSKYVKEFDNKKYIHYKALELYGVKDVSKFRQQFDRDLTEGVKNLDSNLTEVDKLRADLKHLEEVNSLYKMQIEEKNNDIKRLQDHADKLATLLDQEQQLHLLDKNKLEALEDKQAVVDQEQQSHPRWMFWKR